MAIALERTSGHEPFRLRLPATSANLGACFDTAAVALDFYLEIEAEPAEMSMTDADASAGSASGRGFSIVAEGRDADLCSALKNNLILDTYARLLKREGRAVVPLAIRMNNGIPLGMGCGSSAAGRLAAIAMAAHFGQLGWSGKQILEEACAQEGHPDNAAACWLGGLTVAACEGRVVHAVPISPPQDWKALVVMPREPLATAKARAVLPATYSRADAVANVQAASLLGLAFAQGRAELLRVATHDRIHQPYRAAICPLLPKLLPLAGQSGILSVTLSGAGPSVLLILDGKQSDESIEAAVGRALARSTLAGEAGTAPQVEFLRSAFAPVESERFG